MTAAFRGLALVFLALSLGAGASPGQTQQLAAWSARLAGQLRPLHPRLVAVVDFRTPEGQVTPQSHYLAWLASVLLEERAKRDWTVADHPRFDAELARLGLPAGALAGEALRSAGPDIGADLLVIGTLERRGSAYLLTARPVALPEGRSLAEVPAPAIEASEFLESLGGALPEDVPGLTGLPEGILSPYCVRCPDAGYSALGKRHGVEGISAFEVLIGADGGVERIRPAVLLGYGLDEEGFRAVKKWKLAPARKRKEGTAVRVIVRVEVAFRR